ncbi:MAG TPA: alpha-glucosidase [Anaerolineales bacterium]|nr:alpha-glucosidase [Anaerolineales bacterium]
MAHQRPWWEEAIFYHLYLRSFADSNGDGLGDIPGLIAHLDHLRGAPDSLGVDAVWLSPIFPSPDVDFGYDVTDYRSLDPRFGSLADFDHLIAEAHRRGLRIVLDLVLNHTSDQHPWFLESRSSPHNPRRDWYYWREPRPGRRPPNNWQAVFGGRAWEWDEKTQQFYYHMFLRQQPDLNLGNPAVRHELIDVARFWLDRGVDGFRLDAFNVWGKHPDLPDNPLRLGIRPYDGQVHRYDMDHPTMEAALTELRGLLDEYGDRMAVGETIERTSPEKAALHLGEGKLHLAFNFAFGHAGWNPQAFLRAVERWEAALGPRRWPVYVLSDHDGAGRHVARYGRRQPDAIAKVAAAMLLTLRGTPFIYYGDEIALPPTPIGPGQILDPVSKHYWPFYNRDPGRAPLPWNASPHAGFTSGRPWLPLHPGFTSRNVEAQRRDPDSVFSFYRKLIALRAATPALRRGSFVNLTPRPRGGWAYLREHEGERALVALNFYGRPLSLRLDPPLPSAGWDLRLTSTPRRPARIDSGNVVLAPYEAAIFVEKP